jgi:hypothetical protein
MVRKRKVSAALKAYAKLVTSADKGSCAISSCWRSRARRIEEIQGAETKKPAAG